MTYHRRFRNHHRKTVDATRRLIHEWGRVGVEAQWHKSRRWLDEVSAVYEVPTPTLHRQPHGAGSGYYMISTNSIHMPHPSIVTLLHEFRHAYQHSRPERMVADVEDDARAWSLSLYYKVAPRTLRRLAREGKVLFMEDAFPMVRTGLGEQVG